MPRWQRIYLALALANLGYALGYVATDYLRVPRLYYFPFERAWRLTTPIAGVPMGYVGLWGWAIAAGLLGGAIAWLATAPRKSALSARALGLVGAWSGTATVLALSYYTWNNWP
jgi:hypothetical protein